MQYASLFFVMRHHSTSYVQPIATDEVTWSVGLSVCQVFLFVTTVSPAKTAEPTEMPVGMWTRVGPRNYVLDRVQKGRPPLIGGWKAKQENLRF